MIENNEGTVTMTGPHIEVYRLLAIKTGLKLEANTGMRLTSRGPKASVLARNMLKAAGKPAPAKLDKLLAAFTAYVDAVQALTPPDAETLGQPS